MLSGNALLFFGVATSGVATPKNKRSQLGCPHGVSIP